METTITLTQTANRVAITVGGELVTTTKDGGNLIQRVDRILAQRRIHRGSGYSLTDAGLVATAADFR
jgi:hypothetical protein